MSKEKAEGFKTALVAMRDDISKTLDMTSPFVGNTLSGVNHLLDNLNNEVARLQAEAKVLAEREAKNLEEARKVVAAADAAKAASVATTQKATSVAATSEAKAEKKTPTA